MSFTLLFISVLHLLLYLQYMAVDCLTKMLLFFPLTFWGIIDLWQNVNSLSSWLEWILMYTPVYPSIWFKINYIPIILESSPVLFLDPAPIVPLFWLLSPYIIFVCLKWNTCVLLCLADFSYVTFFIMCFFWDSPVLVLLSEANFSFFIFFTVDYGNTTLCPFFYKWAFDGFQVLADINKMKGFT